MVVYYLDILKEYYPKEIEHSFWCQQIEFVDYSKPLKNTEVLNEVLYSISEFFDLNLEVIYIKSEFEILDRGMPLPCDILNAKDKEMFQIGVSIFGEMNKDVTLCEGILLLVQEKLFKDGKIPFDDSFIESDDEFIPFLVIASVYFGFLLPLLYRVNVTGEYMLDNVTNYSYKYHLPIYKEQLLETIVLVSNYKGVPINDVIYKLLNLDKDLKKEILKVERKFF